MCIRDSPNLIICDFPYNGPCPRNEAQPTTPLSRTVAVRQAEQNYATYAVTYNSPPYGLMIRAGLWLELEVIIAYVFGLGFTSLMGQRMVPIILMIVYAIIFRPFLLGVQIPHFINFQRSLVELAVAHLEPAGIGTVSYTHLDVYKRQLPERRIPEPTGHPRAVDLG